MLTIKAEAHPGMSIQLACAELVAMARRFECAVECEFNGISVHAHPEDTAEGLYAGYERAIERKCKFAFSADRG